MCSVILYSATEEDMKKRKIYELAVLYCVVGLVEINILPDNIVMFLRDGVSHFIFWLILNIPLVIIGFVLLYLLKILLVYILIFMYSSTNYQFFRKILLLKYGNEDIIMVTEQYAIITVQSTLIGKQLYIVGSVHKNGLGNMRYLYYTRKGAEKAILNKTKNKEKK